MDKVGEEEVLKPEAAYDEQESGRSGSRKFGGIGREVGEAMVMRRRQGEWKKCSRQDIAETAGGVERKGKNELLIINV
jgi:hypothetical protein